MKPLWIDIRKATCQKISSQLDRNESMSISRVPLCSDMAPELTIQPQKMCLQTVLLPSMPDIRVALEIQTDFKAVIMKTPRPIKWFGRLEIMPFYADSATPEISIYLAPGSAYRAPESRFRLSFP